MKKIFILTIFLFSFVLGQSNEDCMECHNDKDLTMMLNDTTEISAFVDMAILNNSMHAEFECIDCHADIAELPHEEKLSPVKCYTCHEDAQEDYVVSIHGEALAKGSKAAASCSDCHGRHNILSSDDTNSMVYHGQLPYTCGNCHSKPEIVKLFGRRNLDRVATYQHSVHGKILKEHPDENVATCTDCHGSHKILPAINSESHLNLMKIAETCGTCHQDETAKYHESIHWNSLQRGYHESPTCTDCHGEHEIRLVNGEKNSLKSTLESSKLCATCHSSPQLMSRFGLDAERLESYTKSYHGLAVLKDSPEAATCTSCHEVHAIRSSQDTLCSVHSSNLNQTCGKCHEDVTESFTAIDMHPVDQKSRNPIAYFFKNLYIWMIIVVIGGMLIHNIIIFVHHIREKRRALKYSPRVRRFQPFEVYQHLLMFFSFSLLALTGFALKFPGADWVILLTSIGMTEAVRAMLHRIGAVVMIVISIIQLFYLLFSSAGRKEIIELTPKLGDLVHLRDNLLYYFGINKTHPKFGRYDYGEKAEYLALIWGVAVMCITGLVLWFPEFFIGFLPSWLFEVSEVIHYYEAWLATLAIIVWHWFFVIFHPTKYPMNLTWMDGKITEEELKHHHPLEYEKMMKAKKELKNE